MQKAKVRVSGPGVVSVKSADILASEKGKAVLKALKQIKAYDYITRWA